MMADLRKALRSIATLKGHLTRTLDRCDQFLKDPVCEQTRGLVASFQDEITKKHEALEMAVSNAPYDDDDDDEEASIADFHTKHLAPHEKRVSVSRTALRKLGASLLQATPLNDAGTGRPNDTRPFDARLLRPFLLTQDHSPSDFRLWQEEFATYFAAYGLDRHPVHTQQGAFRKSISTDVLSLVRDQMDGQMRVYSQKSLSCMKLLEEAFMVLHPAFERRLEYEETGAEPGEQPLPFLKRLVALYEESDIGEVHEKDKIVFKFLSRHPDQWIRGRVMELKSPTFSDLHRLVESRQKQILAEATLAKVAQRRSTVGHPSSPVATVQAALLDGSCASGNEAVVAAASSVNQKQKFNRRPGRQKTAKPPATSSTTAKRCSKCGTSHKAENSCFVDARDLVCASCGKHGHARRACTSVTVRSVAVAGSGSTPAISSKYVYPADDTSDDEFHSSLEVHPKVTPLLRVRIRHSKGRFFFPSFPDSGSAISLISSGLASRFGVEVFKTPASLPRLTAVNGESLRVDGVAKLRVGVPQSGISASTVVVVSPDVKEKLLLGYPDLRQLGIIDDKFPSPPSFVCKRCHKGFVDEKSAKYNCSDSDNVHLNSNSLCSVVNERAIGRRSPHTSARIEKQCDGGYGHTDTQSVDVKTIAKLTSDLKNQLLADFKDVISDTLPERPACGKPMRIHLKSGEIKPTKILTARKVPLHWEGPARRVIDKALADGIITKVEGPTDWISPAFFVDKRVPGETSLRLVTDFTGLNRYVLRPVHPFPSSQEIVSGLDPRSRYFCKMDAVQGYHQIPLDEDSSLLTTFILPWGRFRYRCAGMGLSASSDEWCRRSDRAIEGIPGVRKLVDDFLVEGETLAELRLRIRRVLDNCRRFGITISKRKLEIAKEVKFAGFRVSADGVVPDPSRLDAITAFPRPGNVTALRGFVGLINQLNVFTPEIAMKTNPFRGLLKKGSAFHWLPEHEAAFIDAKRSLARHVRLHHFDRSLRTSLVTDASRLHGLGFMLVQHDPDGVLRHVIQCGSRSLKPAEANYATIELECLAIQWAVDKCQYFLRGCGDFTVRTDHRPLIGVFQKALGEVANPRIFRFREKLLPFSFDVAWLPGKKNLIADALSRNPCDVGVDDLDSSGIGVKALVTPGTVADRIRNAAASCDEYQAVTRAFDSGSSPSDLPDGHPVKLFSGVWSSISRVDGLLCVDGHRIIVPRDVRGSIVGLLHKSHCGLVKTYATARNFYFWPAMKNDLKTAIDRCEACQSSRPSLPADNLVETTTDEVLNQVSVDLFQVGSVHYLLFVDRYSGFPLVSRLKSLTSETVIRRLKDWFHLFGYPRVLRSDGGPQFRSRFAAFCKDYGIRHEISSPYNSQSNGHAEAGVKNLKGLIHKVAASDFDDALFAWRNTVRSDGVASPAELFFKRRLRGAWPALDSPSGDSGRALHAIRDKLKPKQDEGDLHGLIFFPLLLLCETVTLSKHRL